MMFWTFKWAYLLSVLYLNVGDSIEYDLIEIITENQTLKGSTDQLFN